LNFPETIDLSKERIHMISVIVPIFNAEEYLCQCIESICAQTYLNLEIILVDDGSEDNSRHLCEQYSEIDNRIVVIHKKNGGPVAARNEGMAAAHGEYLAFVDSDDWIEPDMYERMLSLMKKQNVDIIMTGRYEDTGEVVNAVYHGIPEGRYDKNSMLKYVYPRMIVNDAFFDWGIFPGLWDKLFLKDLITPFLLNVDDRIVMGDDAASVYPCLLNANSIYIMHECYYHYRQSTTSVVKQKPDKEAERNRFQLLYQSVKDSLKDYKFVYDMEEQWKKYILFLMTSRSDGLYRGFEELDYLYPFPAVKKGSSIVLYGAGTYGQRLYQFLQKTKFCDIVVWVDRNYIQFQNMGLKVQSPSLLSDMEYDAIVIANTYEKSRRALYKNLIQTYPEKKVHLIDETLIFSEQTMYAYGLTDQ
jgi:glycosyltransferase involved in cell wall biosynthesis